MTAPCEDCLAGVHGPNHHRRHLPPAPAIPAVCGATTTGMYGRTLGPCLNDPGHPQGSLHRDAHGAEWLEYDYTSEDAK